MTHKSCKTDRRINGGSQKSKVKLPKIERKSTWTFQKKNESHYGRDDMFVKTYEERKCIFIDNFKNNLMRISKIIKTI